MSDRIYAAVFVAFVIAAGSFCRYQYDQGHVWVCRIGLLVLGMIFTIILRIRLDRNRDGL